MEFITYSLYFAGAILVLALIGWQSYKSYFSKKNKPEMLRGPLDPEELKQYNKFKELLESRHKSLEENTLASEVNAERYLFLCNAGGLLAVTALSKSTSLISINTAISISLAMFFIGIICVGFLHIFRISHNYKVKVGWEKERQNYFYGRITFEEFITLDYYRNKFRSKIEFTALLGFIIYIIAVAIVGVQVTGNAYKSSNEDRMQENEKEIQNAGGYMKGVNIPSKENAKSNNSLYTICSALDLYLK